MSFESVPSEITEYILSYVVQGRDSFFDTYRVSQNFHVHLSIIVEKITLSYKKNFNIVMLEWIKLVKYMCDLLNSTRTEDEKRSIEECAVSVLDRDLISISPFQINHLFKLTK
uniref:Uncharacterized protein n=1 Tax=viral metagenome TaxID=1070528 RepID=A0A6C0LRI2_9ZZZZ